jgi:hypothetical protein
MTTATPALQPVSATPLSNNEMDPEMAYLLLDGMYAKILKNAPIKVDEAITRIYFTTMGQKDLVEGLEDAQVRKLGALYKSAIESYVVDCYMEKMNRALARVTEMLKHSAKSADACTAIRVPRHAMRQVNELANEELSVKRLDRRQFAIEELGQSIVLAITHKNMRDQLVPLDSPDLCLKLCDVLFRGAVQELDQHTLVGPQLAIQNASKYLTLAYYLGMSRYYPLMDLYYSDPATAVDRPEQNYPMNLIDVTTMVDLWKTDRGPRTVIVRNGQYRGLQAWHTMCMDHSKSYATVHEDKVVHPDVERVVLLCQNISRNASQVSCGSPCKA